MACSLVYVPQTQVTASGGGQKMPFGRELENYNSLLMAGVKNLALTCVEVPYTNSAVWSICHVGNEFPARSNSNLMSGHLESAELSRRSIV